MTGLLRPPRYTKSVFAADVTAGLIVGIVALPLCIAFAIASGVTPERGVFTGVIAGTLIALFSGSKVQIGGPSGPFVIIALGILTQYGLDALMIATFMAGVILLLMSRIGFGTLIKYIPYPVTTGFTSGVGILLITSQFGDLLGLTNVAAGLTIFEKWIGYFSSLGSTNVYAVAVAAGTIILHVTTLKPLGRIPGSLIALVLATVTVKVLALPVETIGSRFQELASGLPAPRLPHLSLETVRLMVSPAIAIALLAAMESLLAAVVADGMTGGSHNPNRVLAAQGLANIGSALFGCLPATAAIARTATNVRNGATTALSGVTHSLLLLFCLLFFGKWAALIPLPCLAGILVVVSYHLFDWRSFAAQLKSPTPDIVVLFTTLGITLFVDLATGVQVGITLAGALFIQRMASVTNVNILTRQLERDQSARAGATPTEIPKGVDVYEINGPFFFGAVYRLKEALQLTRKPPRIRIIRMEKVNAMDSTGLHALEEVWLLSRKQNSTFLISEIHAQPFSALLKSGLLEKFGEENVLREFEDALARARSILRERTGS